MTNGMTPENGSGNELAVLTADLELREFINRQTGTFTATLDGPDGQANRLVAGEDPLGLPIARGYIDTDETQVMRAVPNMGRTVPSPRDDALPYNLQDIQNIESGPGLFSRVGNYLRDRKGRLILAGTGILLVASGVACGDQVNSLLDRGGKTEEQDPNKTKDELGLTADQRENFDKDLKDLIKLDSDKIALGPDVDWSKNPYEAGTAAFTEGGKLVKSGEEWIDFLKSGTKRANVALAAMKEHFKGDPEGYKRYMSGEHFIAAQMLSAVEWHGTTYAMGDQMEQMRTGRKAAAGDVVLLYYEPSGHIDEDASARADCGNPKFIVIIPQTPSREVPPIETPPTRKREPVCVGPGCKPEEKCVKDCIPEEKCVVDCIPEEKCPPGSVPEKDRCVHVALEPTGHEGPARQPGVDPGRTPGYTLGNAETVVGQQDSETPGGLDRTTYGTGAPNGSPADGGEASRPDSDAQDNDEYDGSAPNLGTGAGTSNNAGSSNAQTGGSNQESAGDAGGQPG